MKRIILILMMFLLIGNASALDFGFDNFKKVKDNKTIEVWDKGTIGEDTKLAEYRLEKNTDICLMNCSAEGTAILSEKGKLFSDLNFKNRGDSFVNIKRSSIYIEVQEEYEVTMPEYQINVLPNGSKETTITGYHPETRYRNIWEDYHKNNLNPGTYRWRIEGSKGKKESVDWIASAFGEDFTEWAWWDTGYAFKKNITGLNETVMLPINDSLLTYLETDTTLHYGVCKGVGCALYYNDTSVHAIASDTTEFYKVTTRIGGIDNLTKYNISGTPPTNLEFFLPLDNNFTNQALDFITGELGTVSPLVNQKEFGGDRLWGGYNISEDRDRNISFNTFDIGTAAGTVIMFFQAHDDSCSGGLGDNGGFISTKGADPDYFAILHAGGNFVTRFDNEQTTVACAGLYAAGDWVHLAYTWDTVNDLRVLYMDKIALSTDTADINFTSVAGLQVGSSEGNGAGMNLTHLEIYSTNFTSAQINISFARATSMEEKESQFTLPTIILNFPANLTNTSASSVIFNCSANEPTEFLHNVSLIINNTLNFTVSNTGVTNISLEHNISLLDGTYNWTCNSTDSVNEVGKGPVRVLKVDRTFPLVNITYPLNNVSFHKRSTNLTINWTVSDDNLAECWGSFDGGVSNVSLVCLDNNLTLNATATANDTFEMWANDSVNNIGYNISSWNYLVFENNQTFNTNTTEGNLEDFLANVTLSGVTISRADFFYNGTSSIGIVTESGSDTFLIEEDLIIPDVGPPVNLTFYWQLELSNGNKLNLTDHNQTVYNLSIDNCTTFADIIMNFTVYDEELQNNLSNTTIELFVNITSGDRTTPIMNVSDSYADNPTLICLSRNLSASANYSLDAIIKYQAIGYAIEYYNIVQLSMTQDTPVQEIKLFDLNDSDSTDFKITFTGENFVPVENALIFIDRQYISEGNVFKTVELPKTDADGQTIGHFVRNDIIYNIRVVKNGVVLGDFQEIRAFCDDASIGDCQINLEPIISNSTTFNYNEEVGIIFDSIPSYNNVTNVVSMSFTSSDGAAKTVTMQVNKNDIFGNRSLCNQTLTSPSGSLSCNVGASIDESSIEIKIIADGVQSGNFVLILDGLPYGAIGYVIWFILTFVLIMILGSDKTSLLVSLVISYVGAIALGISGGGIIGIGSAGIWVILITILGIWKLNKENLQ